MHFLFQGQLYEQIEGGSHGISSPPYSSKHLHVGYWGGSPKNSREPTHLWKRYVDDTSVIRDTEHKGKFLQCINSIDNTIKFIVEDTRQDHSMPFLDTITTLEPDRTLSTSVCRKPYTDKELQWHNHHHIAAKYSIINTFTHRTKIVCSTPGLLRIIQNIYLRSLPTANIQHEHYIGCSTRTTHKITPTLHSTRTIQSNPMRNGTHSHPIHTRTMWKHKKCMQKIWGTHLF